MKVVIDVNDNQIGFFMELMKKLDFIKIEQQSGGRKSIEDTKRKSEDEQGPMDEKMRLLKEKRSGKTPQELKADNIQLRNLLLSAPVMTDEQYQAHKILRKRFNKWRRK